MIHRFLSKSLVGAISLFLVSGCGGSEVGNPETIGLQIVGVDSSLARMAVNALAGGITLTEARVVVTNIQFRAGTDCSTGSGEDVELAFEGPYVVDLLTNTSLPDLGQTEIPSGTYCRIELKLHKMEDTEVPAGIDLSDPIRDRSFTIAGTREDLTPFVAFSDVDAEFRLVSAVGFEVGSATSVGDFFIAFDLAQWFVGVDLDSAVGDPIEISDQSNETLLNILEDNLKTSAALFDDDDGNGELEADERDEDDELAEGE